MSEHTIKVERLGQSVEKPENGLKGLKHLRHDVLSGMVVSLVSLPLSSGIAIASGVPPIYGLISAIIAGIVYPFIGGSYMTIAGPAAGLAPALFLIQQWLGGAGDAEHLGPGYAYLLCVIFLVGVFQILLVLLGLAKYCSVIPTSVVEGMLASIGVMIIVKQIPALFGYTGSTKHMKEAYEYAWHIPSFFEGRTDLALYVGVATLGILVALGSLKKFRLLTIIPPQLIAVVLGSILGYFVGVGTIQTESNYNFLISLPKDVFHGIHLPAFGELLTHRELWGSVLAGVLMLTMIDGVESLATAMAIDRIDPYRRRSQPSRVLLAMGVSNIVSSLVGGLTIIPGGVKSKANIASGGRTLWANFTNAICLILYLVVAREWINHIPKGVLAAVLIYTGYKMCEPLIWRHMAAVGKEQLFVFCVTMVATLATDLLIGIAVGTLTKYIVGQFFLSKNQNENPNRTVISDLKSFFSNPIAKVEVDGTVCHIHLNQPLVSFNSMNLTGTFQRVPADTKSLFIHVGPGVRIIDHTSHEQLQYWLDSFEEIGCKTTITGLERARPRSAHPSSMLVTNESVLAS